MFFRKNKKDSTIKKLDKIITWIIIWWAVASAVWLSKTKKWKEISKKTIENIEKRVPKKWIKKVLSILWKIALFAISLIKKR